MARGDKNYDKTVRKVNKGQKAEKRKSAIHKMVESIIKGNSNEAEDHLHDYLTMLSREMIIGEGDDVCEKCGKDSCECDDKDKDEDEDDDAEDEDDDEAEDMKEDIHHPEGAMSRKVTAKSKSRAGHKQETHGNASPGLDDKVKGKAKYSRYPKGKTMKKHGNNAPGLKDEYKDDSDGRDERLGTTD